VTQPGGSATINGVLYQVLGTLGRAVELSLIATLADGDIASATILIEPRGGGGDLQVQGQDAVIVEQWKTRSGGKTWSLREVVHEVLPDLYRAAGPNVRAYRFVTDGRVPAWPLLRVALAELKVLGNTPKVEALDDTNALTLSPAHTPTLRGFFLEVVAALKSSEEASVDAQAKTWHLLSRLEVEDQLRTEHRRLYWRVLPRGRSR
jgi:hypothetical protein